MFKPGQFLHPINNYYKRLRYGTGCCDVCNLDYYLAKKILPALIFFKERVNSHPGEMTFEEWKIILDKMIFSFTSKINGDSTFDIEKNKEINEGFEMFGKYYSHLWL
jgi:hypothetical protein